MFPSGPGSPGVSLQPWPRGTHLGVPSLASLSPQVIFRGERRLGHAGEVALDEVHLSRGPCSETRGQHHM